MKLTRTQIFGVAVTILFIIIAVSVPRARVITLTNDGFSPRTLSIRPGETVTFKTERGQPFWPASDYHPTHALFPAFDPKEPVLPGQSWSFTFTAPGTYPFHDHLNPKFQGVIIAGSPEEARAACLGTQNGYSLSPQCWALEVQDAVSQKGLMSAFSLINTWYESDPRFRENCHDVMHIVGADAYRQFKTDDSIIDLPETAYCGYGFYHGFIETMIAQNGPSEYADARTYCEDAGREGGGAASGPCFHGIGHATFDSLDGSLWGNAGAMVRAALAACSHTLVTDFSRAQCGGGVFNSFANAMSAHAYSLSFSGYDPLSFCNAQDPLYREGCYGETGIGYIRDAHMTQTQALAFVESVPDDLRQYMYFVYFSDETKRGIETFSASASEAVCAALSSDRAREGCIRGVVEGIREETQANESFKTSFPFCADFTDRALHDFCYSEVANQATRAEASQPEFRVLCAQGAPAGVSCR